MRWHASARYCTALVLCLGVAPCLAEIYGDVHVGVSDRSNVSGEADGPGDTVRIVRATLGAHFDVEQRGRLTLQGDLERERYRDFGGLDSDALVLGTRYRHPLGAGFRSPWLRLDGSIGARDFEDAARDGTRARAGAGVVLPLGAAAELDAGYSIEHGTADDTVFDSTVHEVALTARAEAGRRLSGWTRLAAASGESVITAPTDAGLEAAAQESAPDPVFGPGFTAYRFDSERRTAGVGGSLRLGRFGHLALAIERTEVDADGAGDYADTVRRLDWRLAW